ncbi:MAG: hypothetical protein K2Z81_18520, partial [Cyanobacteria bacterium]|nr:hypothetical protein [Cyanobacteriota bacterium]
MKMAILTIINRGVSKLASLLTNRSNLSIVSTSLILFSLLLYSIQAAHAEPAVEPTSTVSDAKTESSKGSPADLLAKASGKDSPKKIEDLPNFHEVHPYLYRSGVPTDA